MPTLKLTNLTSCKAYFAAIATKHKEIDMFRWGDEDVFKKDGKVLKGSILWVKPYDGAKFSGDASDNVVKMKLLELRYLKPSARLQADKEVQAAECDAVIEQILAKMYVDKRGYTKEDGSYELLAFRTSSVETENIEVPISATLYIGTELRFEFIDNTGLQYDATKWNE